MDASVHAGISILEGRGRVVAQVGRPRVNLSGRSVFDATVDGRASVVKVDATWSRSDAEAAALRLAREHKVPVPELFDYIDGTPAVLVMAKVVGTSLTAFLSCAIWREAGFTLRRIHSLPPGPRFAGAGAAGAPQQPEPSQGERMAVWTESEMTRSRENGLLSAAQRRAVRGLLNPVWRTMPEAAPRLVHGDAQAEHFLVGPDRRIAGVVDFGDVHLGDPVADLAVLTLMHPGQLEAVLTGYRPSRSTRERINALMEPYRILRHVAVANWKADNGIDPAPHLSALRARVFTEPRTIQL